MNPTPFSVLPHFTQISIERLARATRYLRVLEGFFQDMTRDKANVYG